MKNKNLEKLFIYFLFVFLGTQFAGNKLFASEKTFLNEQVNNDYLEFYLLTVGLGEGVEARYGHTVLRVIDKKNRVEHNYNWGMFDFSDPNFLLNFFLGKLRYWASDESFSFLVRRYRDYEKRPLYSDKIFLNNEQKKYFYDLVANAMNSENKYFWYQYFFKNCSTIPRDLINETLNGELKNKFDNERTGISFRDYVRKNLNRPPIIAFLLDILMNDRLDRPITKWEEMFYPPKLREYLLEYPNKKNNNISLLGESRKVINLEDVPESSWYLSPYVLVSGLLILFSSIMLYMRRIRILKPNINIKKILSPFAFPFVIWGLFSSVLGAVMLVSWMFSGHLDLHHNANLWLFWPVDIFIVLLSFSFAFTRCQSSYFKIIFKICFFISILHLLAAATWILGCMTGIIGQNCNWVISYLAPLAFLVYLLIIKLYFRIDINGCRKNIT